MQKGKQENNNIDTNALEDYVRAILEIFDQVNSARDGPKDSND
jgi:molecular chaperone GrpE (heat shock protein)